MRVFMAWVLGIFLGAAAVAGIATKGHFLAHNLHLAMNRASSAIQPWTRPDNVYLWASFPLGGDAEINEALPALNIRYGAVYVVGDGVQRVPCWPQRGDVRAMAQDAAVKDNDGLNQLIDREKPTFLEPGTRVRMIDTVDLYDADDYRELSDPRGGIRVRVESGSANTTACWFAVQKSGHFLFQRT